MTKMNNFIRHVTQQHLLITTSLGRFGCYQLVVGRHGYVRVSKNYSTSKRKNPALKRVNTG